MNFKNLAEKIFKRGNEIGFTDMEVYFSENKNLSIKVFESEIDRYTISEEQGISFRGLYNGKMGYSYSEKVDESSIDILVKEAKENAEIIDSLDDEVIFEGSKEYNSVNCYDETLDKINVGSKIDLLFNIEKEAKRLDNRVKLVNYCLYGETHNHIVLINTKGLNLEDKRNLAYAYISVMAKEGDDTKTGSSYIITNDFNKINGSSLAKEAVYEAISMFGAKTLESKEYPCILRNNVSADILEAFTPIFSAENVQKNLSLLKDKLDKKVASEILSIVDDPFMKNGAASSSFDGEGVATKFKNVIDKGVLKTYFHNNKTAKKDGVISTGNASKPSYKSSIGIAPTNMYIKENDNSIEDMIKSLKEGILITDVQGLHSGLNPVSGDFSLSASGFEIKNGNIVGPVEQITIAGNYFEVLKNIKMIGNDLKFSLPSGSSYIGSPSILINKLSISGK